MSKRARETDECEEEKEGESKTIMTQRRWTDSLERLNQVFQKLTPFCAFCEARLTTIMTFQSMQSAVPELMFQDLVAIKTILPTIIEYNYADESQLNTSEENASKVIEVRLGKQVSQLANRAKHTRVISNQGDESRHQAIQRHLVKPAAILKTIQRNNEKFVGALDKFVETANSHGYGVDQWLEKEMKKYYLEDSTLDTAGITKDSDEPSSSSSSLESLRSITTLLSDLKQQPFYYNQLDEENDAYQSILPAKPARYGHLDAPLSASIQDFLNENNTTQLYLHQAQAINALRKGENVIISTSTSSGKSLIYQIPILETLLSDSSSRALFIFPTKALAQDQRRSLMNCIMSLPSLANNIKVSTYDGDTPSDQRALIRSSSQVILTNPDMLHYSILPNATKYWQTFFYSLKYIVIDEVHVYHGVFGTNMALILRRLRRLILEYFHNDRVQFISCSATVANPQTHMKQLVGISNVTTIEDDGAPSALKKIIIWNPPLLNNGTAQMSRRGAVAESASLLQFLVSRNIRTIAFCKIRKTCELLMKQVRENLEKEQRQDLLLKIHSYRGGYTPITRRRIEQQMFRGDLLAIIATNALELGIDIGSLDAVMMVGIPWSLSSFWQQSGRAGRRNQESLTIVVLDQNPMDQHYLKQPQSLFEKDMMPLLSEVENNAALESHLHCAAEELAIQIDRDQLYFGPHLATICKEKLIHLPDLNIYRSQPSRLPNPSHYVNIRGMMEEETYAIVDTTDPKTKIILEEIEASRAPFEVYEGAIFIHQGRTYLVEECNVDHRYAKVHLTKVDWTTRQRDYTNVNVLETKKKKPILSSSSQLVSLGQVEKETIVFGYYKLDKRNRILDSIDIHMDPIMRTCFGLWFDVPSHAINQLDKWSIDPMAAIHASAHLFISLLPQFTHSNVDDVKTECKSPYATRHRPNRIVLYESLPCGVLRQVYDCFERILRSCMQRVDTCECESGCPNCVYLLTCSEQNLICSKTGARLILRSLLDMSFSDIDPPSLFPSQM
ncbi:DEAD H helicase [Halteromyces radiatus]|uniref:DEAD H helicase n=1 Tax=Halteromyces radiatus TaxID=101107 RepID=UPI00221EF835|nr:DEAD H helicase [Halteromyces radiatus]KAI8079987.1 DEAD H helicase [Halteromyces radiatus]